MRDDIKALRGNSNHSLLLQSVVHLMRLVSTAKGAMAGRLLTRPTELRSSVLHAGEQFSAGWIVAKAQWLVLKASGPRFDTSTLKETRMHSFI